MNTTQHDVKEFSAQIALECQKLDDIFAQETTNYRNTPNLQGKSWFSIGLENNDKEQQKDDVNKASVIGRMVAAIRKFIGSIIARIKSLYTTASVEKTEEVVKEFKTKKDSKDKTITDFVNEASQKRVKSLSKSNKALVCAVAEKSFQEALDGIDTDISTKLTGFEVYTVLVRVEGIEKYIANLTICNDIIKKFEAKAEEQLAEEVANILKDPDTIYDLFSIELSAPLRTPTTITKNLQQLDKVLASLADATDQESLDKIKACQTITTFLSKSLTLIVSVNDLTSKVMA